MFSSFVLWRRLWPYGLFVDKDPLIQDIYEVRQSAPEKRRVENKLRFGDPRVRKMTIVMSGWLPSGMGVRSTSHHHWSVGSPCHTVPQPRVLRFVEIRVRTCGSCLITYFYGCLYFFSTCIARYVSCAPTMYSMYQPGINRAFLNISRDPEQQHSRVFTVAVTSKPHCGRTFSAM